MIATGTDVKPIECLVFMRDVWSKNYFEQMKGRGTRVLSKEDLQKVTPSAKYSLQGTTQGRYLTGGVPPVRFSM